MGRDGLKGKLCSARHYFNSHARVGRDLKKQKSKRGSLNFNSHARVGRDEVRETTLEKTKISTHTPAWGATSVCKIICKG